MKSEILVGITGRNLEEFKDKLEEVDALKIKRVSIFLEFFNKDKRKKLYKALKKSGIKEIPFVHARHDMKVEEYMFLIKTFKTRYFNLHINAFELIEKNKLKWIKRKILFEHSYCDTIKEKLNMKDLGGFCIDLSHFKAAEQRQTNEFKFVVSHKQNSKLFIANHLNGYDPVEKKGMHFIKDKKDFEYLRTLPKFVFGKYIALEMFNSIKEQLEFKEYLIPILKEKVNLE